MSTRFYDTDLTDAAWAWVAPVLPAVRPGGGVEGDLAFFFAFAFPHSHLPGTIPNLDIAQFQAGELAHPQAGLQ
jgi:hypothetical protein